MDGEKLPSNHSVIFVKKKRTKQNSLLCLEIQQIYSDFRWKLSEARRIKTHILTLTKIYFMYNEILRQK